MDQGRPKPEDFEEHLPDDLGEEERAAFLERLEELKEEAAQKLDPAPLGSVRGPMAMPEVLKERPGTGGAGQGPRGAGRGEFGGGASARAWAIGLDFGAMVIGGGILGWIVDWLAGTKPWGILVGLLAGLVVGFTRFVKEGLRASRKSVEEFRGRRGG
jgi:putative F0F1-ATPase subunit (Ca2+/Mg2+ transporter)